MAPFAVTFVSVSSAAACSSVAVSSASACAFVVASCRGSLHAAAIVLFGACGVASLCIFLAYASLFAFHAYLAVLGMGTYDWILAQRAEPPKPATELVAKGARVAQEEDAA